MTTVSPACSPIRHDSEDTCREVLEALGELRHDWINNPKYMYRAMLIYAPLVGALGVLSGYALYFQVEPIVHVRRGASLLFTEVSVAVALGAVSEWIRQVIDEGAKRLPSRRTVLSTVLTLLLFEIFLVSAHNIANPNEADIVRAIRDVWQGDARDFVMVALLWIISGAVLSAVLSRVVFVSRGRVWADARSGMLLGAAAGAVAAAIVLGYILVARAVLVVNSILTNHQQWHAVLEKNNIASVFGRKVDYLIDAQPFGHWVPVTYIVFFLATAAVLRWSWKAKSVKPIAILVVGVITVLGLAVVDVSLIKIPAYVWLALSIPGALLGAVVPWLRSRARLPHGFGVGLLLLGLALLFSGLFRLSVLLMLLPATILALCGIEIIKNREVKEYWPLAALSIAIITCFMTPLQLNPANFRGLLGEVDGLTATGPIRTAFFGVFSSPTAEKSGEAGTQQTHEKNDQSKSERGTDLVLSQLCIVGSLGFWVSVGLLVCWSIRLTQDRTKQHSDGKRRCFWVSERSAGSMNFHDNHHGVLPKTDQELFARLAVDLLTHGSPWLDHGDYIEVFDGFVPQKVAQMNGNEILEHLRDLHTIKNTRRLLSARVSAAIENAQCILNYQSLGQQEPLIRALQLQAANGPQSAVTFFRSIFKLKRDFPAGSFLQSTGFLPGAHFAGCWRHLGYPDEED